MSNLRDLLSKANRKHEMRWKVLVFDPKKDNELVDEFKDFECIDCAAAKKRELLEKHPDKTIEIIAESINRKTEAGKEIKVGNQRFYTTNDNGIIFVRKIAPYDDADYYYAVYDPQKVRLVFTQSGGKNKQASMVKYNDTAKQIEEIAKKLIELNKHIQPKMVHESSQKNEGKVNMSKLKNEIQAAVNKYFKDDKDLLEYVHIETKKDKLGRDVLEVRAELGYNSMVKLADYLDKIVTKYDKYAYFDQETSGIMTAVFESAQKNETKHSKDFTKNIYTTLEKVSKAILKVTDSDYRKAQQTLGYAAICLAALQNYVNHVGQSTDEWLADHPTEADKYYKQAIDATNKL